MLLSHGCQLFEELAENDGAVDYVFHPQCLGLLLQPGRAAATPEQGAVQRLAAVPDVRERQLSGVPSSRGAVGVSEDQVSKRRLSAFYWEVGMSQENVIAKFLNVSPNKSWIYFRQFE